MRMIPIWKALVSIASFFVAGVWTGAYAVKFPDAGLVELTIGYLVVTAICLKVLFPYPGDER